MSSHAATIDAALSPTKAPFGSPSLVRSRTPSASSIASAAFPESPASSASTDEFVSSTAAAGCDKPAKIRGWLPSSTFGSIYERCIEKPWEWSLAAQRSENRSTRLIATAVTGAVGLAISVGIAIALGASLTPLMLQLSVAGGAAEGMAAQLYILGDALSLLFGQGAGPFGNVTTVINMAALTRALIGQGTNEERRSSWLIAQAALGLALSPLIVSGVSVSAGAVLTAAAAGAGMSMWIAASCASPAEPSYQKLLMGIAVGVAVAPMASKLAFGQSLARVIGEALEGPTVAAAALVLWDFWQSIQNVRRSPASQQAELDLTEVPSQIAVDFARPDTAKAARMPPLPRRPSLIGIDKVVGLEDSAKAQFLSWYSDDKRLQRRERKQWLFYGRPGVGKRSSTAALARYFDALLLEVTPADLARAAEDPPEGGFLHGMLERAEFLQRKHNRMVIVSIHNVDKFLAPESEAGKTSSIDSSDLLDSLTCNHPTKVPPILIVGTTDVPLEQLPKRLVERFTRRYAFGLNDEQIARRILEQKLELALEQRLPVSVHVPQLRVEQLAQAAREGVQKHLSGGDFERYAAELASNYGDKLLAQNSALRSLLHGDTPADLQTIHELEWPQFLALMGEKDAPSAAASMSLKNG